MPAALRPCRSSMPDPSFRLMSRMMQATDFEIGMIFESLRRREQDGVIPMLFQHSRNSPQHRGSSSTTNTSFPLFKKNIPMYPRRSIAGNNRTSLTFLHEWIAQLAYHFGHKVTSETNCQNLPKSCFALSIRPVTFLCVSVAG